MPQRFLRPGITNSDAWNSVGFCAQSFYIRILTLVDDYGRYDGRTQILHSHCFALRPDIKPQHSAAFRSELSEAGLIIVYQSDGKEFIQLTKWHERARGLSKYPAPPESAAERSGTQPNPASLAIVPSHRHESSPSGGKPPGAVDEKLPAGFDQFWAAYPKKEGKLAAIKAWGNVQAPTTTLPMMLTAIEAQKKTDQWTKDRGQFIPHPSTWLNAGRWQDELKIEIASKPVGGNF